MMAQANLGRKTSLAHLTDPLTHWSHTRHLFASWDVTSNTVVLKILFTTFRAFKDDDFLPVGPLKMVNQPLHPSKWGSTAWTRRIFVRDGHNRSPDQCSALTGPGQSLRCFSLFTTSDCTLRIILSQPKRQDLICLREFCQTLPNNSQVDSKHTSNPGVHKLQMYLIETLFPRCRG